MPAAPNIIYSAPGAAAGASVISNATAWLFGSWVDLLPNGHPYRIAINGITFQMPSTAAALDIADEMMFEIGSGLAGAEVTVAQIPYSNKQDTIVGYLLEARMSLFFPEPIEVKDNVRLAARVTDSRGSATTYTGVKVFFRENSKADLVLNNYQAVRVGDGMSTSERIR